MNALDVQHSENVELYGLAKQIVKQKEDAMKKKAEKLLAEMQDKTKR